MDSYSSYTSNREGGSNGNGGSRDHVCRPVHVDAQGRRTPLGYLSSINGLQGYVVKAAEGHGVDLSSGGDEEQDLFEKIRKEVSRPKSNTREQRSKYIAAASQQILQLGSSPGKYSSAGVEVAPPPYFGGRQTIDSEEAKRRYGQWGAVPPPQRTPPYYGTIDSREATKRYGGARF